MTLQELKPILKTGKWGIIPNWIGNIKYDYYLNLVYFLNKDYKMSEKELIDKLNNRNDLYYII